MAPHERTERDRDRGPHHGLDSERCDTKTPEHGRREGDVRVADGAHVIAAADGMSVAVRPGVRHG